MGFDALACSRALNWAAPGACPHLYEEATLDSNRFDDLTRSMAGGTNRRSVLKAFGGLALGAAGLVGLRSSGDAAKKDKVNICHRTGNGSYNYISVAAPSVDAHIAHGDQVSNLDDVDNCGACGNVCTAPENATAVCGDDGCGFACNDGFEPNELGDECVAASLCGPGQEEINGGCFLIGNGGECLNCPMVGSIEGSDNFLCAYEAADFCQVSSDCPSGQACYIGRAGQFCFSPCFPS